MPASQPPCCIQPAMRVRRSNVGAWRAVSCRDLHRVAGLPIGSGTNIGNAGHAQVVALKQDKVCSLPCISSAPRDAIGVLSQKPPSTASLPFRAGALSTGTAANATINLRRKSSNGVSGCALKYSIAKPKRQGTMGCVWRSTNSSNKQALRPRVVASLGRCGPRNRPTAMCSSWPAYWLRAGLCNLRCGVRKLSRKGVKFVVRKLQTPPCGQQTFRTCGFASYSAAQAAKVSCTQLTASDAAMTMPTSVPLKWRGNVQPFFYQLTTHAALPPAAVANAGDGDVACAIPINFDATTSALMRLPQAQWRRCF